ncbi:MAG: bifunctional diaminohydroxyphosphoribosylaminopyrimidine deaminase/5-amino-6-(5-phosphoribosylamino)uracil reductase RibD [Gammaproteobacteria bacterium]
MFSRADHRHMERALSLAERGRFTCQPNPRVGCVLVAGSEIVGEGWHRTAGCAHAEIEALNAAGSRAVGATAYVTLEPCSHSGKTGPCAPVLAASGITRVVIAMEDPNPSVSGRGRKLLEDEGLRVEIGLLEEEARNLNAGFLTRMERGRPRVVIKLAASLDGRTAMAGGESKWITSPEARDDVQRLRAESSAILTGIKTVLADDPSLNVRSERFDTEGRQPLRVVLDSDLRMPDNAKMLGLEGRTLIMTCANNQPGREALETVGAEVETVPAGSRGVDLESVLSRLGEHECNDVLVEAGPTLCGSLLSFGHVDEIVFFLAPHLMGHEARSMFHLPGLEVMSDKVQLEIVESIPVGVDLRVRARLVAEGV